MTIINLQISEYHILVITAFKITIITSSSGIVNRFELQTTVKLGKLTNILEISTKFDSENFQGRVKFGILEVRGRISLKFNKQEQNLTMCH